MSAPEIELRETFDLPREQVLALYQANKWSSADKPDALMNHLCKSHTVVTAWHGERLIGLGNTLSDGELVVYYSHMLVHPEFHGQGVGTRIARQLMKRYEGFHQQLLLAVGPSVKFYQNLGFAPTGETRSMWIFPDEEH